MNPAEVHFSARNNAAWQDAVVITIDGGPFNFGAYAPLQMQVKATEFTPTAEIDATVGDGLAVETDGALGINIPEADMTPLIGVYYYDVRGTDGADKIILMFGTLTVEQGITYP